MDTNDAQAGSKINGDPVSNAEDIKTGEDALLGNEKHVTNHCNMR